MSFEEKSVGIRLLALVVGAGAYAAIALSFYRAEGVTDVAAYVPLLVGAVTLQALVLIGGRAVAALTGRADRPDERDRIIAWRAAGRSGWVLVTGVLAALTGLAVAAGPLWVANVLLGSLVLYQALALGLRLVAYRRGA